MRALAEAVGEATGRPACLEADDRSLEDSCALVADISSRTALGFKPQVTLSAGLSALAEELGRFPELPSARVAFRAEPSPRRRLASSLSEAEVVTTAC